MNTTPAPPHVLCVGGEDHHLRIPFLLALSRHGFRVTAASTGEPAPFAAAGIAHEGFRFERFLNPLADYAGVRRIGGLVARVRPDLVQSFDTKPNILVPLAVAADSDCRVVRTINGMGWVYSSRSPLAQGLRPVQQILHRRAAGRTAATVFQNRDDRAFFEDHHMIGEGASVLIPGSGVDIEGLDARLASGPAPADVRAGLGLGGHEIVITVTRLTRQKGIPTLLRAAALVHAVRPGVRFLLVGPRETEGRLAVSAQEIARHAAYVVAPGPRNDVPDLLRAADVFAFPTEYREGVPRALMEAALAGLPIVTTDMPGCSDVIENGYSGYLVPPRSPRRLAAGILDLLADRDRAREMGRRASAQVRSGFGLTDTVRSYADLYRRVLSRRAPFTAAVPADPVPMRDLAS